MKPFRMGRLQTLHRLQNSQPCFSTSSILPLADGQRCSSSLSLLIGSPREEVSGLGPRLSYTLFQKIKEPAGIVRLFLYHATINFQKLTKVSPLYGGPRG